MSPYAVPAPEPRRSIFPWKNRPKILELGETVALRTHDGIVELRVEVIEWSQHSGVRVTLVQPPPPLKIEDYLR